MSSVTANLVEDLARQRRFVENTVPVYARALELLIVELDAGLRERLEEAWAGRTFTAWYERPLLLLASLRASALVEGPMNPLFTGIGAATPNAGSITAGALHDALDANRSTLWGALRTRAVQTNEPSRGIAWLWPATVLRRVHPEAAIELHDIGASAGLNLMADKLPWSWTSSDGRTLVETPAKVTRRTGYDLSPLDPFEEESRVWLRACVWPGQKARLDRLEQAFSALSGVQHTEEEPRLVTARAGDMPALFGSPRDHAIAYQTVMRGYLSDDEATRYDHGMRDWLASSPGRALWVELEPTREGANPDRAAALTAHLANESGTIVDLELASCHPHPAHLFTNAEAVSDLERLLAR